MTIPPAVSAYVSGLLFGAGLMLSGMTDPANVLAFLDVAGQWNPALAVVMATAVAVAAPVFYGMRRRQRTLFGEPVALNNRRPIDRYLIGGSLLFGVGWGLSGICPGPGLMLAAGAEPSALVFVTAMTVGMWLGRFRPGAERSDD